MELWGSGNQRRESMHIEDFVNQLVLCEKKINNDVINIGPGFDFTIKQWAKIICKIVNYDFNKILFFHCDFELQQKSTPVNLLIDL